MPPPSDHPGLTNLAERKIDVQGHLPIKHRYYLVSEPVRQKMYKEIDELLESRKIEPSQSPWSSPIVMVTSGRKRRMVIDFRKVNAVAKKDAYPLPYIVAILEKLRTAKYISTVNYCLYGYGKRPLSV